MKMVFEFEIFRQSGLRKLNLSHEFDFGVKIWFYCFLW